MKDIYMTDIENLVLKKVKVGEEAKVLDFIRQMAEYEKMSDEVIATEASLKKSLFEDKDCSAAFVEYEGKTVGFVLFFHTFSTFCGRTNMYLEDIFIQESMRGKGFGKEVFKFLMKEALDEGCRRLEWVCLNWNTPSIKFYEGMGAFPMSEWTTYRMTTKEMEEALEKHSK